MIPVIANAWSQWAVPSRRKQREYYPLDDRNEVDPDFDDYSLSEDVFIEEPYRAKSTVLSEKVVRGYQNKENGSD